MGPLVVKGRWKKSFYLSSKEPRMGSGSGSVGCGTEVGQRTGMVGDPQDLYRAWDGRWKEDQRWIRQRPDQSSTRVAKLRLSMMLMWKFVRWDWPSVRISKRCLFSGTSFRTAFDRLWSKEAWLNATDVIVNLLHDDTIHTLENKSAVMKRVEKYLEWEVTTSDNHTTVLKADTSDYKEILALKAELTELKASQEITSQGQGASRRLFNKCHRDGCDRTVDKVVVDTCKTCGNRHPGCRTGRRTIRKDNKD